MGCLQVSGCLLPATESLVHGSAITQTELGLSFQTVVKCRWMPATIWRGTQVLRREDLQRARRVQMQVCWVKFQQRAYNPVQRWALRYNRAVLLQRHADTDYWLILMLWRRIPFFQTPQPRDTRLNWSGSGADQTQILCSGWASLTLGHLSEGKEKVSCS